MSISLFPFEPWATIHQQQVEDALARVMPSEETSPSRLHSAMRYAVLGGGKRVRALLSYAAAELVRAPAKSTDAAAVAVELIHAFSLVHDDMPCMDDDDLRRGKPSCHKQYGDATALLVGDALQSLAFQTIADTNAPQALKQVQILAQATGSRGMCGGQSIDLQSTGQLLTRNELETMHQYKTGALIRAATLLGAYAAESTSEAHISLLNQYSENMGLAFQVVDDILDATADTQTLGKTAGKDALQEKSTYVSLLGIEEANALVKRLYEQTLQLLAGFDKQADPLRAIARFICERTS
ncbi:MULTISPECIES: polyprenyl synthetase family protein [unclassified Methylophilus]|uniref:polyprenyl synthetase family protein n=1 Tax=unclassified Methylophilus TaxID=2630143 RepID=UPI0006F5AE6F|nr:MULTISPECIES: farnesyl diphosphate synthase [unclassified Methylophilus]KQT43991.1 geranyl transferase [Methylophilus sp. Leaf416]KQT59475.1 geranyl transferase [Methylophilus sp. Leaf459]